MKPPTKSYPFLGLLLLAIPVNFLAHGLYYAPALFGDDWSIIESIKAPLEVSWINFADRRPFVRLPFFIHSTLFGLNINAHYLLLWLLHLAAAVLFYKIISHLPFKRSSELGVAAALLFLIYPSDYTHMWLSMTGIYYVIVFTLIFAYFLLKFAQGGGWGYFLASVCILGFSLEIYEMQLGLVCAWSLLLWGFYRKQSWPRRFSLLVPILVSGIFTIWRTLGYQMVGIDDANLSVMDLSLSVLLSNLIYGYKISLGFGWTFPLLKLLPFLGGHKQAFLLLCSSLMVLWSILAILCRPREWLKKFSPFVLKSAFELIRPFVGIAFCGLILIGAGYIPLLAVRGPSLVGHLSRSNLFASLGASLVVAAVLMAVAVLGGQNQPRSRILFAACTIPFVLLGIYTHASVQADNNRTWLEQKNIWSQLFQAAPDFADDTHVVLLLSGYADRTGNPTWERPPLKAPWEVSAALRLLYHNPTLSGDIILLDLDYQYSIFEATLTREGVLYEGVLTPYSQCVFLSDNNPRSNLELLTELPAGMIPLVDQPIVLDTGRAIHSLNTSSPYRTLLSP